MDAQINKYCFVAIETIMNGEDPFPLPSPSRQQDPTPGERDITALLMIMHGPGVQENKALRDMLFLTRLSVNEQKKYLAYLKWAKDQTASPQTQRKLAQLDALSPESGIRSGNKRKRRRHVDSGDDDDYYFDNNTVM